MTEPPHYDEKFLEQVLQKTIELWVLPEVARRVNEGRLPNPFDMNAAQVVFNVGAPEVVRLNSEVIGLVQATAARDVKAGQVVTTEDIAEINAVELTDADPNAAHITILRYAEGWAVYFDSRFNAKRIERLLTTAREFLHTAANAADRAALAPFAENLWAAVELMAKALLLTAPDETLLKSKKHGYLASRYNLHAKHGDVDPRFAALLNELAELRKAARYGAAPLTLDQESAREMLATAEAMFQDVEARTPKRTPFPGGGEA